MTKIRKLACVLTKYSYGQKDYGLSPEYNAIYKPLKKKFKNLKLYNSLKSKNINKNNLDLINFCKKNKPDFLFFSVYNFEFYLETLNYLRKKLGIKLINWSSDDSWRFDQHSKIISNHFDVMVTTSSDAYNYYKKNNKKSILTSWGCPDDWFKIPKKSAKCQRDIIFIGQKYFDREKIVKHLRKTFKVDCYGRGWENKSLKDNQVPNFLRNSKISLNFSKSRGNKKQTKARVFEICGSGSLCISENSPELRSFYSNSEVISFDNTKQLTYIIKNYLKNSAQRDKVAFKANKKTKKKYSYSEIQNSIIFKIKKFKFTEKKNQIIKKTLLSLFIKYIFLFFMRITYNILIIFIKKKLVIKIVRRFFFELEWRMRGEKTYTKLGACNVFFNSF